MPDARIRRGWDRGVDGIAQEGTDARRRFTGQAARVSTGCLPVMLILRRGPLERPGRSLSGLRYPSHELERDAATPSNARFRSRSRTSPVPGHDCGPSRWRISGGCGVPWRCQPGHPGRAESGKTPPCMRWRGPARPRRARPPSWLALPEPRAARRCQVPARGPGLPAPPAFPGSPPGGARFQR